MTRVAAFDCGTNSLRLLIADLDIESGTATELVRDMRVVRLGEGVDRTGRLADTALARVFSAVDDYAALVAEHQVERIAFCATSATRDAENAVELRQGIFDRLGVELTVLDGDAEARASFAGATRTLTGLVPSPYLVVDIGGGSTEVVLGDADGTIRAAQSLDIGSVRLAERHLAHDPATDEEVQRVRADVAEALARCHVPLDQAGAVIGVAGTMTTMAAGAMGLDGYDRTIVHRAVVTTAALNALSHELLAMSAAQRRELAYMHPGRADVIGAGSVIACEVAARAGVESILISEEDILDGIAWSLVNDSTEAVRPRGEE